MRVLFLACLMGALLCGCAEQAADMPDTAAPPLPDDYPTFSIPPPEPSSRETLPRPVLAVRDTLTTLGDVADRLLQALNDAEFGDRSFYAPVDDNGEYIGGFVLATQWEQIEEDGTPLPEPDRWAIKGTMPRDWSISAILRRLVGANASHFRVMVFFITPEHVGHTDSTVTREAAIDWTDEGAGFLPAEISQLRFDASYNGQIYIYEFHQAIPDAMPVQRTRDTGALPARTHLNRSLLWTSLNP